MLTQAFGIAHDVVLAQLRQALRGAVLGRAQLINAVAAARAALVHEDPAVALQAFPDESGGACRSWRGKTRPALVIEQCRVVLTVRWDDLARVEFERTGGGIVIIPGDGESVFLDGVAEAFHASSRPRNPPYGTHLGQIQHLPV